MMSKLESESPLDGSIGKSELDTDNKHVGKKSPMPTDEQTDKEILGPDEMFEELVRLNNLEPATDNSQLIMPTAYKTVPIVTTLGSSTYAMHDED